MAAKQQNIVARGEGTHRISELIDASGATRDSIKYYLRADLLPQAQKPRANLSLYTENHVKLNCTGLRTIPSSFCELAEADLQESLVTVYRLCALYYLGVLLVVNDEHDKAAHFLSR